MITMEQVDEFRRRTNSSYEDAKYFLERNNGNLLDAIIDFERTKTGRSGYHGAYHAANHRAYGYSQDIGQGFSQLLQKGFETRIYVEDNNSVLFSIPVILLLFLIPFWVIMVIAFVFFIMLGYRVTIRDAKSRNVDINDFLNNISEKMREKSQPYDGRTEAFRQDGGRDRKDGYNEYTIE